MNISKRSELSGLTAIALCAAVFVQPAEAAANLSAPMANVSGALIAPRSAAAVKSSSSAVSSTAAMQSKNPTSGSRPKQHASEEERRNFLEAQGVRFEPLDQEQLERAVPPPAKLAAAPKGVDVLPENIGIILPEDTRVQVYPDTFPATAVVRILFKDAEGTDLTCSGALISENTVLTAGHCVHDGINGPDGWYPVDSYAVSAVGALGATCKVLWQGTVAGWALWGRDDYDYGVLRLDCTVGNDVGWFGFFSKGQKNHQPATISGYPTDKEPKDPAQQWWSHHNVARKTGRKLFYKNDVFDGMNGGPIWYDKDPNPREHCPAGGPCIVGVHGYAFDPLAKNKWYRDYNSGAEINNAAVANLIFWKQMPLLPSP